MNIKIKYLHSKGHVRVENNVEIKEVFVKEKMTDPDAERISIGFRNKDSSGLLEFTHDEIDRLMRTLKDRTGLIKDFKIIRDEE